MTGLCEMIDPEEKRIPRFQSFRSIAAIAVALVAGLFFRLINNQRASLWYDESFSWHLCRIPLDRAFFKISHDVHPPLYYVILKCWIMIFGDDLFMMRGLSALAGVACIPATWLVVQSAKLEPNRSRSIGTIASIMTAFNGFVVYYSQQTRMYSVTTLASLLCTASFLFFIRSPNRKIGPLLYAVGCSTILYLHNYGILLILSHLVMVFIMEFNRIWRRRSLSFNDTRENDRLIPGILISYFLIALFYAPWLPFFWSQIRRVEDYYWTPDWSWWFPVDSSIQLFMGWIDRSGKRLVGPECGIVERIVCISIFVYIVILSIRRDLFSRIILASFALPLSILTLICVVGRSLWLTHPLQIFAPYLIIAVADATTDFSSKDRSLKIIPHASLFAMILTISGCVYQYQWNNEHRLDGIKRAAHYIDDRRLDEDWIVVNPSRIHYSILYYLKNRENYFVCGPPWEVHHGPSSASNASDYILPEENERISHDRFEKKTNGRVWIVESSVPKTIFAKIPENWELIDSKSFEDWVPPCVFVRLYEIHSVENSISYLKNSIDSFTTRYKITTQIMNCKRILKQSIVSDRRGDHGDRLFDQFTFENEPYMNHLFYHRPSVSEDISSSYNSCPLGYSVRLSYPIRARRS